MLVRKESRSVEVLLITSDHGEISCAITLVTPAAPVVRAAATGTVVEGVLQTNNLDLFVNFDFNLRIVS